MTTSETDAADRNGSDLLTVNVVMAAPNFPRLHQKNIFIDIISLLRFFRQDYHHAFELQLCIDLCSIVRLRT